MKNKIWTILVMAMLVFLCYALAWTVREVYRIATERMIIYENDR
jgi:hypothetical protein